jgi:hypothetical protein
VAANVTVWLIDVVSVNLPFTSVARNVYVKVPEAVAVPDNTPVEEFNESPVGKDPDAIE